MNEFECVIPILNVKNFAASMDYYVGKLGFRKKWDWGNPPTFGCVTRGKVEIFFCEGAQGRPVVIPSGPANCAYLQNNPIRRSCSSRGSRYRWFVTKPC
jgi:catechol 2,3-dioxygenase-like lactoylglutathione lyase family enzyme